MGSHKTVLLSCLITLGWYLSLANGLVINEFLASNDKGLLDGNGNTSDWIELYNNDSQPISLDGWRLTDDIDDLAKWFFPPGTVIPANGYFIIFASGQSVDNDIDPSGHLHTNFSIKKEGEYLGLIGPDGTIVHDYRPEFPPQETDISYGLWQSQVRYFKTPTPGQPNQQPILGLTTKTVHTPVRGFYDQPFDLKIQCDTPDVVIRYTLDGSKPSEQNGYTYDPAHPIAITTTRIVRSVALKTGWKSADVTTHTYLFLQDVLRQPDHPAGYPNTWAGNPADYGMDPEITTNTLSPHFDPTVIDALLSIPTMSLVLDPDDWMGSQRGIYQHPHERASDDRWERPASIEYIIPDGLEAPDPSGTGFQANCGVKIQGESSARDYEGKHTFRLLFKDEYGPGKLHYKLFKNSPMDRFNTLSLRCCSTDSWHFKESDGNGGSRYRRWDSQYIRDVWMRDTMSAMGQLSSHSTHVHLYVNGLYWGLYNPSERPDDAFMVEYDQLSETPESTDPVIFVFW